MLGNCEVVDPAGSRNMGSNLLDVLVPSSAEDIGVLNSIRDRMLADDKSPSHLFEIRVPGPRAGRDASGCVCFVSVAHLHVRKNASLPGRRIAFNFPASCSSVAASAFNSSTDSLRFLNNSLSRCRTGV